MRDAGLTITGQEHQQLRTQAATIAVGAALLMAGFAASSYRLPSAPVSSTGVAIAVLVALLADSLALQRSTPPGSAPGSAVRTAAISTCVTIVLLSAELMLRTMLLAPDTDELQAPFALPSEAHAVAATGFALVAVAIVASMLESALGSFVFVVATSAGLLGTYLVAVLYLYGTPVASVPGWPAPLIILQIGGLIGLFVGAASLHPHRGWFALIRSHSAGGALARRILPALVALMPLAGMFRLKGELAGLYGPRAGAAVFTVISVGITACGLLLVTRRVEVLERQREESLETLVTQDRKLRESEQLMSCIVSSSDDAMISQTLDGQVTSWNTGAERIFQYGAEEMVGQPIFVLSPPDRLDDMAMVLAKIRGGQRVEHYRTQRRRKDGAILDISLTVSPIMDAAGRIVGASKIARDITVARAAELALLASEEKYRATVDAAPIGIIRIAPDLRLTMANPAICALLGHGEAQMLEMRVSDIMPADIPENTGDDFHRLEHSGLLSGKKLRCLVDARGRIRTCEVIFTTVHDESGAFRQTLAFVSDISERLENDRRQKHLSAQLQQSQKMEAVGQLTGGLAHDFNNLIGVILGNLDFLDERLPPGSDESTLVAAATRAAVQGAELTRRLLAFARQQPLAPSLVQLGPVIENAAKLLRRTIGESIALTAIAVPDLWPVMIDLPQLESALLNLAVNARDAMPDGGTLTMEARNLTLDDADLAFNLEALPGDYVVITVSDTGVGMAPDVAARVFEPFFTTKGSLGTGLGLSMVHGFVKQSGGHTRIYTEPGLGTSIRIFLPRAGEENAGGPSAETQPPALANGEHVLVVEDNPGLRAIAVRQLNELGYTTLQAENAAAALRLLNSAETVDVLFTDIVMPGGMDGRALAEAARALRPAIKVLFTSGFSPALSAANAPTPDELLSKPYRKQDLGWHIRRVLEDQIDSP